MKNFFKTWRQDLPAGVVVFLVAVPLCLGIALASDVPVFSGLIAGIIGGLIVGFISNSAIGVSGPAAGLTIVVATAIQELGSFELLLTSVVIAGIIQIVLSILKAGIISQFFPHIIIKGMLTAIGLIIILKQLPHAVGYDKNPEGDESFFQTDGQNTFSELFFVLNYITPSIILISFISIVILIFWKREFIQKSILRFIPGPLMVVIIGILYTNITEGSIWQINVEHRVNLGLEGLKLSELIILPNFSGLINPKIYLIAFTIAIVASIETLLCADAADKIDPMKRNTSPNRELLAQGVGNIISGLIGGLPLTQVIVRSSTNVNSGGISKLSTIIHGVLITLSILIIPFIFSYIPFASLSIILIQVGLNLAKPSIFKKIYHEDKLQFIQFIVTILSILLTDLLIGILIGLIFSLLIILYQNFKISYNITKEGDVYFIFLTEHMTFLNKASLVKAFINVPKNNKVVIDCCNTKYLSLDIKESINEFKIIAKEKNIELKIIENKNNYEKFI